jgi:signal transduction histidine kinase
MADIASNILHEVGNTLLSIVIDTDLMRSTVDGSRVGRVRQVAELLEKHRENLTHFINHDAQGSQLLGYTFSLSDELAEEQSKLKQSLGTLGKNVDRVRTIIQSQRTYARSTLLMDEYDPAALMEEALRLQSATLQQAGVSVTKELVALPKVRVDKQRVLQILLHLLSNASKALEPVPEGERRLRVRLAAEGNQVRLQVEDNGEGVAPEIRGQLFTQGFSTRKGGYGIGLHSSALSAQLLGGRLTIESDGPGTGAIATLELPITKAASPRGQ